MQIQFNPTEEQLEAIEKSMKKVEEQCRAVMFCYAAKMLLVYQGYSNEEANAKIRAMFENYEKSEH